MNRSLGRYIRVFLYLLPICLLISACWPWGGGGNNSSYPAGSVWQFEIRRESTHLHSMQAPGGCGDPPQTCDCDGVTSICSYFCTGQQAFNDPIYLEQVEIVRGEFKIGSGLSTGQLIPTDVRLSMKVSLPASEFKERCEEVYGERGDIHGRQNVLTIHNTADKLEWFEGHYYSEDNQISFSIDPPSDLWEVEEYTYRTWYNTIPGRVSGIGSWSSTSHSHLTGLGDFMQESNLENGQWVEEYGPLYYTDDGGFTYVAEHTTTTFMLQCMENCGNKDCSQLCYDGKECTDDTCIPGQGCTFEPLQGSCSDNNCYEEGICQNGECIQEVPVVCDDDPCTIEWCDPIFGCVYDADNKVLSNEDPHDCEQTICLNGIEQVVPAPNESPSQGPDDDCWKEICLAGYGEKSVPTDQETPPQNPGEDCLREVCTPTGEIISIPYGENEDCSCTRDWECEDENPCTRESCDPLTNTCIFHGPDDSLTPPQIDGNCKEEVCQGGLVVQISDDGDLPDNLDPFDCSMPACSGGEIQLVPDNSEGPLCVD